MNTCYDKHEPVYKITYRSTQPGGRPTEWHVCDWCYEKRSFGTLEEIQSIQKLAVC